MKVKAKRFPVRYKGITFMPGVDFVVDESHFNENLMEQVEEVGDEGKPKPPSKLTKDELKGELDKINIPYDSSATKDELLKLFLDLPTE
jgi:hypothetical protein